MKKLNAYSAKARWLLIAEAILSLLLPAALYLLVSRIYSEVLLNKSVVSCFQLLYTLTALASMWKFGIAILSFTLTSTYMKPHDRELIRRCRPLYWVFFLWRDRHSHDGWVVVTHGPDSKKSKLYLFKP